MQRFLPFLLLLFVLALVLRVDLLFAAVWFLLGSRLLSAARL